MVSFKFLQTNTITSDQINLQYVMDTLNIIRSWSIPRYEDPKLILPELPHNSNIGIKFNYNLIGTPNDHNTFTLQGLNPHHYETIYVDFTYDEFKNFITLLVRNPDVLDHRLGNKIITFSDDFLSVGELFDIPILIPYTALPSIHYVWQPIINFNLHFHMNTDEWGDDDDD